MKIFAYYLPQFHCIPENDEWWGKGFTEWTNVKKAKPLFKGHNQPTIPLNNNYYDLSKVETLKWQEQLMKKFNVDGLIFYHYYFKGKKLLEKPAEMLLDNKELNINFFFCWANHTWYRSWQGKKDILVEQKYGDSKDWEKHFNYLLPFFKDKRYEKKDNKPILLLFNSGFREKENMISYFNKRCLENGFNGICIIETINDYNFKKTQKKLYIKNRLYHFREPTSAWYSYTRNYLHIHIRARNLIIKKLANKGCRVLIKYSGDKFYKLMIKQANKEEKNIIRGLFFEWDNTPRHGYRGYIITPPKKELFMKYMNRIRNDEYVFVNAWNEWCEGMMMEPTTKDGYKYLEWIKEWKDNENRTDGL